MHTRLAALTLLGCAVAAAGVAQQKAPSPAAPQPRAPAPDPGRALLDVHDADPLELARAAARIGDAEVLALLARGQPVATRLAAVRAARWLREPERALDVLVELIVSRDSELAPAAARAALQVTRALDADELARREIAAAELTQVLSALLHAAELPRLRADLRQMAAAAAEQLRAAGVPDPAVK